MAVRLFDTPAGRLQPGSLVDSVDPKQLVYFLLNVGDGDTQLVVLPEVEGRREGVVVDVLRGRKLARLIDDLRGKGLLSDGEDSLPLVVATHPHADHMSGMATFLQDFDGQIDEFWEPGYYHGTPSFFRMMDTVKTARVRHGQPTSGMVRFIGDCKVTVLAPGVVIRNKFDSYGIDINDSSISLKIEFPAQRVYHRAADRSYQRLPKPQALLLGGDAQTRSWAQVMVDFPQLGPNKSAVAEALRKARGVEPLKSDVFKVPHHASKHGLNLELVEEVDPKISLISSVGGGGKYNFPHLVALEGLREAIDATAQKGTEHSPDFDLGIHYTFGRDDAGAALGSIAVVMSPTGGRPVVWRFGDDPDDPVDLAAGRRFLDRR